MKIAVRTFVSFLFTFLYFMCFSECLSAEKLRPSSSVFVKATIDGKIVSSTSKKNIHIPASIIKVATAAYSLFTFGENHRFSTRFYLTQQNDLVIEGAGDPGFTSNDLRDALSQVAKKTRNIRRIILDNSFYSEGIKIPGRGSSARSYDAPVSALSINFNTLAITKKANGQVYSGELETPLTSVAKQRGMSLSVGTHRVNVGRDSSLALEQLAELSTIFLKQDGVKVLDNYLISKKPTESTLIVNYQSSKILKEYLIEMLKYSNNFMANQLFFIASAYYTGPPVINSTAVDSFNTFLKRELNFGNSFQILEGAGLSPNNRLSTDDAVKMMKYFYPYRDLLVEESGLYYKSGTLTGVSNLAGYDTSGKTPFIFVLFDSAPISIPDRVKKVKKML